MIVRLTTDHHLNHQNNHIITTINHDYDELIIGNMCVRMGNVDQIPLSGFHSSASNRNGFKISPLPTRLVRSTKHEDFAHWEKKFTFLKHKRLIVSFHDFPGEKFTLPPNLHVTILSQVLPLRIRQRPLNGLIGRCWFQHCCWCWHLY